MALAGLAIDGSGIAVGHPVAAAPPVARFVSGWVPYWAATDGRQSYESGSLLRNLFADVSPFWYSSSPTGGITLVASQSDLTKTINAAPAEALILPTITDGSGKGVMAAILADPARRANHIAQIVQLVVANGYDGIDLDYEGFAFTDGRGTWSTTRPNWITFVGELSTAMHAVSKQLAITIPPSWTGSNGTDYWVYDPVAIIGSVDRLRFMVYDWSPGSPSATAPMAWVNQVISWTNARITDPAQRAKIQLGVPAYGRDWGRQTNTAETCPDGALTTVAVQMENGFSLAASVGQTPVRDATGELTFSYTRVVTGVRTTPVPPPVIPGPAGPWVPEVQAPATGGDYRPAKRLGVSSTAVTCTVKHTVYFPDAFSVKDRAVAAMNNGWAGIAIWALGYEDDNSLGLALNSI